MRFMAIGYIKVVGMAMSIKIDDHGKTNRAYCRSRVIFSVYNHI